MKIFFLLSICFLGGAGICCGKSPPGGAGRSDDDEWFCF